jgi:hypothetical protein
MSEKKNKMKVKEKMSKDLNERKDSLNKKRDGDEKKQKETNRLKSF